MQLFADLHLHLVRVVGGDGPSGWVFGGVLWCFVALHSVDLLVVVSAARSAAA